MKRLISILSQERPPRASLRYFEKCLVILDMLQVQALLFGLSQPWSGTYLWLENTQWTACFNLDLFLLSKHGAPMGARGGTRSLWGEMDSVIPRYCVPLGLSPLLLATLYWAFPRALPSLARSGRTAQAIRWHYRVRALFLLVGQYLVVPCGLAVLRLLHCRDNQRWLDADPAVACGGFLHAAALTVLLPIFVGWVAVVMSGLVGVIYDVAVYSSAIDHDMFLQRWEAEWELQISDTWLSTQLWLISSYRRHAANFRVLVIGQKLALVLCYTLLYSQIKLQAVIFWVLVMLGTVYTGFAAPFRCRTSNAVLVVSQLLLLYNATLGVLTCLEIEASMLVATTQTIWLFVGNGIAAICLVVLFAFTHREPWPVDSTREKLEEHGGLLQEWATVLRDAREVVVDCNMSRNDCNGRLEPEVGYRALLVPIHRVEAHMKAVHQCWIDAKTKHSLLESSLRETLEDLVFVHEKFDNISLFPENLDAIRETKPAFDASHDVRVLMKPQKRRILNKLVGIRWLNQSTPGGVINTSAGV